MPAPTTGWKLTNHIKTCLSIQYIICVTAVHQFL